MPCSFVRACAFQNPHVFAKIRTQALYLATGGVAIATVLTAVVLRALFVDYGWDWPTSYLAGTMLSATDPVAVVAVLREIGAPAALSSLIEGESLLNDGTAFVGFLVFKDMVEGASAGFGDIVWQFMCVACWRGGVCVHDLTSGCGCAAVSLLAVPRSSA